MRIFIDVQQMIYLLVALGALIIQVIAFVDIVQRPSSMIDSVSRQPKNIWLLVIGIFAALNLLSMPRIGIIAGLGIFVLMGVAPALHWLLSIRPGIGPRRSRRPQPGGQW